MAPDPAGDPRRRLPQGYNEALGTFTQYYGATEVDASLLQIPLVGFLPCPTPRVAGTIAADRARADAGRVSPPLPDRRGDVDGLPEGEGAFLACTFWLADAYMLQGRDDEAHALFERLLA